MISIEWLYKRLEDLSRKDKAGYMSDTEFTRDVNQASNILLEYYHLQYEKGQNTLDALQPFITEKRLPIVNGYVDFPSDYRHRLELGYIYVTNTNKCEDNPPTQDPYPMDYLNSNEEMHNERSPIRKSSIEKKRFYHLFVNNKIKVLPSSLTGFVNLKYIRRPIDALYSVKFDTINRQQNFDAATSVDLEWSEQESHNIVDLLLFFKGLEVRETALINWVMQHKQYTNAAGNK